MTKATIRFGAPEGYRGDFRDIRCNGESIGSLTLTGETGFRKYNAEIRNPVTGRYVHFKRPTIKAAKAVVGEYMQHAARLQALTLPARTRIAALMGEYNGQPWEAEHVYLDERTTTAGFTVTARAGDQYGTGATPTSALADLEANLKAKGRVAP